MAVTRVSRTKRSSDYAVGTLEFEFKEDSRNGRVSGVDNICFLMICDAYIALSVLLL